MLNMGRSAQEGSLGHRDPAGWRPGLGGGREEVRAVHVLTSGTLGRQGPPERGAAGAGVFTRRRDDRVRLKYRYSLHPAAHPSEPGE